MGVFIINEGDIYMLAYQEAIFATDRSCFRYGDDSWWRKEKLGLEQMVELEGSCVMWMMKTLWRRSSGMHV